MSDSSVCLTLEEFDDYFDRLCKEIRREREQFPNRGYIVCDKIDPFDETVPDSLIKDVFASCRKGSSRGFMFFTDNKKRVLEWSESMQLPGNVIIYERGTFEPIVCGELFRTPPDFDPMPF